MATTLLNVTLIESAIFDGKKEDNLKQLETHLAKIPSNTDIVILPELFSTGFISSGHDEAMNLAEKNTGETIRFLQAMASKYNCAFAGTFMAHTADRIYNRAFFIEPSGEDYYYDKYHLFSIGGEDRIFSKGNGAPKVIRFRGCNILLMVCYDLRFPVWCRNDGNKYDLLIVMANWPKSRVHSWESLTTTRAIENLCYVCAVNRIGTDSEGIEYDGNSRVIDFRGKVVATKSDEGNIINYTLNLASLKGYRENFPVWKDADDFILK